MPFAEVSRQDLFKACASLFGTDIDVSVEFLRYLKPSGVKAAYRKKAMETHPDRAAVTSGEADFMADQFKEISQAYQVLQEFLAAPWKYSLTENGRLYARRERPPRPAARRKSSPETGEPLYAGRMPQRRLLFGQYLYYSGQISLSTLIKAIVWQRLQRPSVGAIAMSWGWLAGSGVLDILRSRKYGEKFGECATRLGRLSQHQMAQILEKQRLAQPQIGKYFMEQNILSSPDIFQHVVNMRMHNRKFWS
ncbi:MAG: J domain-containing protein [Deltaproteobacteria bacterium]|nr:J domain-containing protein [Deltaproteobacteria bacterium]